MKNAQRIRIKRKPNVPVQGRLVWNFPDGPEHQWTATSYSTYRKSEYMVDTHGFQQCDFNPCFHEKYIGNYTFSTGPTWTDCVGAYHGVTTSFERDLRDPVASCRTIILPLGSWIEDFSARAENHFTTLVSPRYSLANFLIEIIQLLEGNASLLERLKNAIEAAVALFRRHFRETGNLWLAWNFAIKPTLGDLRAMLTQYEAAIKRLAWLRKRNRKVTKVHYREGPREYDVVSEFEMAPVTVHEPRLEPPPDPPIEWVDWMGQPYLCEAKCNVKVRLSAWANIWFDIPDFLLDAPEALGIVMATISGLYNPVDIAWEAVPFSWLIDWFRTTAHKLRESRKTDLNPLGAARILSSGWTMKTVILGELESLSGMTVGPFPPCPQVPQHAWPRSAVGAFRYSLFLRQPGLPQIGDSPFRVPWEWYNASILGAILQQKSRRG